MATSLLIKMSSEEATKSADPAVISKARGFIKGQVTSVVKKLERVLVKSETGVFEHQSLNRSELTHTRKKLEDNFQLFQRLHTRYCEHRAVGDTDEDEENLVDKDAEYLEAVESKVFPLLELYADYDKSFKFIDKIPALENEFEQAVDVYNNSKMSAATIVECLDKIAVEDLIKSDEIKIQPASTTKANLRGAFDTAAVKFTELISALEARGNAEKKIELEVKFMYKQELTAVSDLSLKLDKIIAAQNCSVGTSSVAAPASADTSRSPSKVTATPIKLNKPEAIKFSGNSREFATFKRDFNAIIVPNRSAADIGLYLKQAVPTKHLHLIANVDIEKYEDMMDILSKEFGTSRLIVDSVVSEIERMKVVNTDRMFLDFVEKLEKIHRDLKTVKMVEEVANATVIGKLEAKLPPVISQEWTKAVIKEGHDKQSSKDKFDKFMEFLSEYKEMVKYQCSESRSCGSGHKTSTQTCFVTGLSSKVKLGKDSGSSSGGQKLKFEMKACLGCDDGATNEDVIKHSMETCEVWNSLKVREKEAKVKCKKHPFARDHTSADCNTSIRPCRICQERSHHSLLCPKRKLVTKSAKATVTVKTNVSASVENPVIVQALFVQSLAGRMGTLLDNCSTDNYITNSMARKIRLQGEKVQLMVEGIGGEMQEIDSTIYRVPIKDKHGQTHFLDCYGMEMIATQTEPPDASSYKELCSKFGVSPRDVRRPRSIDLLISMRDNHLLADQKLKTVGKMALYEGLLGKVFGGSHPILKFPKYNMTFRSTKLILPSVHTHTMRAVMKEVCHTHTAKSDKEFLDFFKEENIGAECSPKCGGCLCGKCALGGKQMSLKDEKDYNLFLDNMKYDREGTSADPGPYWRITFPWIVPKSDLIENKPAVIGVMNATAKKLNKDPSWRGVYEAQLKDLISRGVAREVFDNEINNHKRAGGQVYYIAHQMALNPDSKSTPVRTVFNCSQMFKGYSLNSSMALGPEHGLNSLHSILLRFREGKLGAQGDISKQYYMVRVDEYMMQLWLWRFSGEEKIRTFCMTRMVMGVKSSANFAVIAMKETAKLYDYEQRYPVAKKALSEDSYMDNTFVTAATPAELEAKIKEVEFVASEGGFKYKEWIVAGQNVPDQVISVALPNALGVNEEKALGIHWDVVADKFFVKVDVSIGSKKKVKTVSLAPYLTDDILSGDAKLQAMLPIKLTLRVCLSIHAKTCDPLGLILPTKMVGTLLFRSCLQFMNQKLFRENNKLSGKIPWDIPVDEMYVQPWLEYFKMLLSLESVVFPRSTLPDNVDRKILPDLITFNDGNPEAFGAVVYYRWSLLDGTKTVNLVTSKAKLGPLQYRGETSRNELASATFAARLKCWVIENSELTFGNSFHFLDSKIVKDMIRRESYGFNTYAGLRIAEIQKKTSADDWYHIPSRENIADILTKGVNPGKLGPDSVWQSGPKWLVDDQSEWPVTDPVLNAEEKEVIRGYQTSISKKIQSLLSSAQIEDVMSLDALIRKYSCLEKLIRVAAYVLRLMGRKPPPKHGVDLQPGMLTEFIKTGEREIISKAVSALEYHEAWMFLICWEQKRRLDSRKHSNLVLKDVEIKLTCHGDNRILKQKVVSSRMKNFPVGFSNKGELPVVPSGPLAKLVTQHYHDKYHVDIDTTVAHVRNDVWIPRVRKLASEIDKRCKICLIKRNKVSSQLMGNLPEFRFEMASAFTAVCMDLFGPIIIKDDCVKKGSKIYKKVFGVMFTCTASRAVHIDVAIDYSTEAILHTLRRLMSLRGDVKLIVSDPGSQLVGASKELISWRKSWSQDDLDRFSASRGVEWKFIMAASQHQNGAAESMIKFSKGVLKSLVKSYGDSRLTLNELNTLLLETANLVNERPIGVKPNSQTDVEYLSPNSLLLGRNSSRISSGPFQCRELFELNQQAITSRFLLVQRICDQFWSNWTKLYFPTLLWQQKWHHLKRNLQVNDVCVLSDSGVFRGEWRLCRVSDTYPDSNGVVRNVEVVVARRGDGSKLYQSQVLSKLKRHVSKLIVIVPVEDQNTVAIQDQHEVANNPRVQYNRSN